MELIPWNVCHRLHLKQHVLPYSFLSSGFFQLVFQQLPLVEKPGMEIALATLSVL